MKELKLLSFVSIDGYSSRLNGDMDWVYSGTDKSPLEVYDFTPFFASIDRVVMNRMQYLALHFQDYVWPIRDKQCFVLTGKGAPVPIYSRGLLRFELLTADDDNGKNALQYIRELRSQSGKGDIWVMGDFRLTAALLQQDLIDEINILRLPVTLGSGISFLAGFGAERSWQLCQVSECAGGAILTRYHRANATDTPIAV
jgi:dihydrofolate reductase